LIDGDDVDTLEHRAVVVLASYGRLRVAHNLAVDLQASCCRDLEEEVPANRRGGVVLGSGGRVHVRLPHAFLESQVYHKVLLVQGTVVSLELHPVLEHVQREVAEADCAYAHSTSSEAWRRQEWVVSVHRC